MRSLNFNERTCKTSQISMLLFHYTGMENCAAALERLCDKASKVSAHYLIDELGEVYSLVPEEKRAWHAGVGFWQGEQDINSFSIGIELVNGGHKAGLPPFPEAQMAAVETLARELNAKYQFKFVLGHSDIAPARKQDPGEKFNWERLFAAGVGLWVEAPPPDENFAPADEARAQLSALGYDPACATDIALAAFQRHWRQGRVDGKLDRSTRIVLDNLLKKI